MLSRSRTLSSFSFLALLLFSLVVSASNPPRRYGPCAGPPLPPPLNTTLAQQLFHESDRNYRVFDQNLGVDMAQKIYEGRIQQARHYRLLSDLLVGSSDELVESFSNPQPGDFEHARPMMRYYYAYLHGVPVAALASAALDKSLVRFEEIEKKGKPTNYISYDAIARSVLLERGRSIDPVKYFGSYFNAEDFQTETAWLESLFALRGIEDLLDAKRYEETAEQLLGVSRSIDELLNARVGCAEGPSIVVGEILRAYVSLGTQLVLETRGNDVVSADMRPVLQTLGQKRTIMKRAIDPIGYPAISSRILRAGALYDRLQADVFRMSPRDDEYRIAAEKAEALAAFLERN